MKKLYLILFVVFVGCTGSIYPVRYKHEAPKHNFKAFYCYMKHGKNSYYSNFQQTRQYICRNCNDNIRDTLYREDTNFIKLREINKRVNK
jgi:hypothetical protein